MNRPQSFDNWIIQFNVTHTTLIQTMENSSYEIFFRRFDQSKHTVEEGIIPFPINFVTSKLYTFNIPEFTLILPGPVQECNRFKELCCEIYAPEELAKEYTTHDLNPFNNHQCVAFSGVCEATIVGKKYKY